VGKYFLNYCRIFAKSRCPEAILAMILTSLPHLSQVSTSRLKTRFKRFARVIARDGMYAGFAGAKTGHRSPFFGRGLVGLISHVVFFTFAPPVVSGQMSDMSTRFGQFARSLG
jgi:hypothetical protein